MILGVAGLNAVNHIFPYTVTPRSMNKNQKNTVANSMYGMETYREHPCLLYNGLTSIMGSCPGTLVKNTYYSPRYTLSSNSNNITPVTNPVILCELKVITI